MKKFILTTCFALLVTSLPVAAQQTANTKACNAEAVKKALKGDKRTAYVKNCMVAKGKSNYQAAAAKPAIPATPAGAAGAPSKPESAATPAVPSAAAANGKARQRCEDLARQSNVSPAKKTVFLDKCMAG